MKTAAAISGGRSVLVLTSFNNTSRNEPGGVTAVIKSRFVFLAALIIAMYPGPSSLFSISDNKLSRVILFLMALAFFRGFFAFAVMVLTSGTIEPFADIAHFPERSRSVSFGLRKISGF